MSLLSMFGLDDLADSVNELTADLQGIKDDIVSSVVGPGEDLKETVNDIASSINETPTKN